jgi:hypothetical protein
MSNDLTSDNPLLSRPTLPDRNIVSDAIACTQPLPDLVAGYVTDSLSENTRRAYLSDLAHFESWGGSLLSFPKIISGRIDDAVRPRWEWRQ